MVAYLIIQVEIHDKSSNQKISSLVFTEVSESNYAKKLAIYHIYHLHTNDQTNLPFISSVQLDPKHDHVQANETTFLKAKIIGEADVAEVHRLGRMGLFGYNKSLKYHAPKFSLMNRWKC